MATYRLSIPERNACLDGLTSLIFRKSFPANAVINIYSNATTEPLTPELGIPGGSVLLSQVPFSSGAFFPAASGTTIASGLPLTGPILTGGTASWFAFIDGTGILQQTGSVTVAAASGDMIFDNTVFVSGGIVSLNTLSISMATQSPC